MHPIDDIDVYNESLTTVMFDIIEKQFGPEILELSMEELEKRLNNKSV